MCWGDAVAVHPSETQGAEDQHVERTRNQVCDFAAWIDCLTMMVRLSIRQAI